MAWAALCALVCGMLACGGDVSEAVDGASVQTVRGSIVGVEAGSVLELTSLELRDENGATWHFEAEGYQGFTPSHLRQHMLQGLSVTVTYHEEEGILIIDGMED